MAGTVISLCKSPKVTWKLVWLHALWCVSRIARQHFVTWSSGFVLINTGIHLTKKIDDLWMPPWQWLHIKDFEIDHLQSLQHHSPHLTYIQTLGSPSIFFSWRHLLEYAAFLFQFLFQKIEANKNESTKLQYVLLILYTSSNIVCSNTYAFYGIEHKSQSPIKQT